MAAPAAPKQTTSRLAAENSMLHTPDSLYQSLLEINNILVQEVTPEGFFSSLAKILQSKIGCDRVSLTIYESETDSLAWFAKAAGIGVTCMDSGDMPLRSSAAKTALQCNFENCKITVYT